MIDPMNDQLSRAQQLLRELAVNDYEQRFQSPFTADLNTTNCVRVKAITPTAVQPTYATDGAACFDLTANTWMGNPTFDKTIGDGASETFGTGLAFEVPDDHVMLIFSRSGHGFNHGTRLANCVGVVDSDYRGEVMVKLKHDGRQKPVVVNNGDRIAQALTLPVRRVTFQMVDDLTSTVRGDNGFGSTGA